jgi:hypothetical protein
MKVTNTHLSSQPAFAPPQTSNRWTFAGLIKTAIIGFIILAGGVIAAKDICQQSNMRRFCDGNLGIPRRDMPQVEGDARDAYLFHKFSQGTPIQSVTLPPHLLVATQSQISRDIVVRMRQSYEQGYFNPCERQVLVARNKTHHNIMDGHHTTMACRLVGQDQQAVVIDDPDDQVLGELQQLAGGFRRDLDDSVASQIG